MKKYLFLLVLATSVPTAHAFPDLKQKVVEFIASIKMNWKPVAIGAVLCNTAHSLFVASQAPHLLAIKPEDSFLTKFFNAFRWNYKKNGRPLSGITETSKAY